MLKLFTIANGYMGTSSDCNKVNVAHWARDDLSLLLIGPQDGEEPSEPMQPCSAIPRAQYYYLMFIIGVVCKL